MQYINNFFLTLFKILRRKHEITFIFVLCKIVLIKKIITEN
jgi:hypothetical protein